MRDGCDRAADMDTEAKEKHDAESSRSTLDRKLVAATAMVQIYRRSKSYRAT